MKIHKLFMKLILLMLFLLIILIFYNNNKYEYFWPLKEYSKWFKENNNKYNSEISNNIITRLDCKINLYGIIKGEYYCPDSFLDTEMKDIHKYEPKSIWFIKQRSAGGASAVYPVYYENIKNKLIEKIDKKYNGVPKCHSPPYNKQSQFIIQKSINPLLINGKKCDIRIFYIVVFKNEKVYFYLSNDGILKINNVIYLENSIDKKNQITNNAFHKNAHNNILISESGYYNAMMPKIIQLFKDFSNKIKKLFLNLRSKYLVEYQVCGADVIFDRDLNPYLLELNSGWPAYVKNTESINVTKLKINTKKEISKIVYNSINKIPINNQNLIELS